MLTAGHSPGLPCLAPCWQGRPQAAERSASEAPEQSVIPQMQLAGPGSDCSWGWSLLGCSQGSDQEAGVSWTQPAKWLRVGHPAAEPAPGPSQTFGEHQCK